MYVLRYKDKFLKFTYNSITTYLHPERATQYSRLRDAESRVDNERWPTAYMDIDGERVNPNDLEICQVTYQAVVRPLAPKKRR